MLVFVIRPNSEFRIHVLLSENTWQIEHVAKSNLYIFAKEIFLIFCNIVFSLYHLNFSWYFHSYFYNCTKNSKSVSCLDFFYQEVTNSVTSLYMKFRIRNPEFGICYSFSNHGNYLVFVSEYLFGYSSTSNLGYVKQMVSPSPIQDVTSSTKIIL